MNKLRVLVVEDDYMIATDMAFLLDKIGAVALGPIGRLEDALAFIADTARIDFAIIDIDLSGRPSYPVAEALARRGVPFAFATGFSGEALDPAYRTHQRIEKPTTERALNTLLLGRLPTAAAAGSG